MKRFVPKLDEATLRQEFPIADLLEGWFFRSREVGVGPVFRVEGIDQWGTRVTAEGTDREELLQDCAERARQMKSHAKEVLFHEYGTQLCLDGNVLILGVLCGTVGQFGVELALNDSERERYKREGDSFVKELADAVRRASECLPKQK